MSDQPNRSSPTESREENQKTPVSPSYFFYPPLFFWYPWYPYPYYYYGRGGMNAVSTRRTSSKKLGGVKIHYT